MKEPLKTMQWKTQVVAPVDAKRPRCNVVYSYNGVTGFLDEDDTDLVDWLLVISYETTE
jgi:hypothetical protein